MGLSCLHHVSIVGAMYGFHPNPETEMAKKAIAVATEHYGDHPDLDLLFFWIDNAVDGGAKEYLQRAIKSPHRHVRGNALQTLASMYAAEARVPSLFDANLKLLRRNPEKNAAAISRYSQLRERWKTDPQAARVAALRLFVEVVEQYADVLESPRTNYGPVLLKVSRGPTDELTEQKRRTLGKLAEAAQFELTNLTIGQVAPEIAGEDAFGQELMLSAHRGKVVVVMFSFKGCGPCEAMYPDNRKLLEQYKGRPFIILGVMGDPTVATVKEVVQEGKITWPVWWDGGIRGPITSRWNVKGWPEIYVLDHHGVIRYRELSSDLLALAVPELVEEAEKGP